MATKVNQRPLRVPMEQQRHLGHRITESVSQRHDPIFRPNAEEKSIKLKIQDAASKLGQKVSG